MKAAQTFYGDEVGGALIESDEGDLLADLIRQRLAGTPIGRAEGIFGRENTLTASPRGSPTAASPVIPMANWAEIAARQREAAGQHAPKKSKRDVAEAQMAMW